MIRTLGHGTMHHDPPQSVCASPVSFPWREGTRDFSVYRIRSFTSSGDLAKQTNRTCPKPPAGAYVSVWQLRTVMRCVLGACLCEALLQGSLSFTHVAACDACQRFELHGSASYTVRTLQEKCIQSSHVIYINYAWTVVTKKQHFRCKVYLAAHKYEHADSDRI